MTALGELATEFHQLICHLASERLVASWEVDRKTPGLGDEPRPRQWDLELRDGTKCQVRVNVTGSWSSDDPLVLDAFPEARKERDK